eukprot:c43953_g1_i1 orf=3-200(-)
MHIFKLQDQGKVSLCTAILGWVHKARPDKLADRGGPMKETSTGDGFTKGCSHGIPGHGYLSPEDTR